MPESTGSNIEVAHHLSKHQGPSGIRGHEILEIAEAIVLAMVAITTAWSGYQAALWTGHQAELYGRSTKLRIQSEGVSVANNQERLYNAATVVEWLKAEAHGDKKLSQIFERRLLPEYRASFKAWKATDPLNNPDAPAGPQLMKESPDAKTKEAARLNEQASQAFEQGDMARQHSDDYVRVTVTLATILLLTAVGQRFKVHRVRIGLALVAALLLCVPLFRILTLPRG